MQRLTDAKPRVDADRKGNPRRTGEGGVMFHVYPINDTKEHDLDDEGCWCRPRVEDGVVIHNSLDRRETYEGKPLV